MIQIRPNAVKELQRLLNRQTARPLLVRLNVAAGGCFEWTYQLTFTESFNQEEETAHRFDEFTVVLPNAASPYLQNLTIDYAEDLMGGGFRFVNPQAQQTCGCGNSFSLGATTQTTSSPADCTPVTQSMPTTFGD